MSRCSMTAVAALTGLLATAVQVASAQVWKFDNLACIGGLTPLVEGAPRLVDSPVGKAVQFNGRDTALFFGTRPLVGARTFTIEAIMRPEGGAFAQRWMHVVETDPKTGLDAAPGGTNDPNPRYMFEVRVVGSNWYLDGFVNSKSGSRALAFPDKLHPIGPWYAVAQSYDGKTYRTYVDGVLQGQGDVGYAPQGPGHVMVGVRINHVNYFQGSVAELRFTSHALAPDRLLKVPGK